MYTQSVCVSCVQPSQSVRLSWVKVCSGLCEGSSAGGCLEMQQAAVRGVMQVVPCTTCSWKHGKQLQKHVRQPLLESGSQRKTWMFRAQLRRMVMGSAFHANWMYKVLRYDGGSSPLWFLHARIQLHGLEILVWITDINRKARWDAPNTWHLQLPHSQVLWATLGHILLPTGAQMWWFWASQPEFTVNVPAAGSCRRNLEMAQIKSDKEPDTNHAEHNPFKKKKKSKKVLEANVNILQLNTVDRRVL